MSFCSVFIYMGAFDSRWTLAMDRPVSLTDFNSEFAFRICFLLLCRNWQQHFSWGRQVRYRNPKNPSKEMCAPTVLCVRVLEVLQHLPAHSHFLRVASFIRLCSWRFGVCYTTTVRNLLYVSDAYKQLLKINFHKTILG